MGKTTGRTWNAMVWTEQSENASHCLEDVIFGLVIKETGQMKDKHKQTFGKGKV